MKQQLKVKYFSPEQAKYINPDLIDYVTLNDGSKIKMGNIQNCPQKACQNQCFCNRCGKVKYMGQVSGSPYVFRGGKKKAGETTVSGVGIEINPEGVEKDNLLTDILTGGDYNAGDDQNGNQGQIPQGQGQEQGYYDGDQQGTEPIQYNPVPEQYENPTIGYTDEYADPNQYYPGEQNPTTSLDDAIRYGPNNPQGQPQGVQEEYVNPDIPNENYPQQDYPQQPEEQIPVQTPYIPVNPVAEQPQPSQPYQQPSQPYQQPSQPQSYPYQQPSQPQSYPYQQPSQPPQQNQPYQQPMGQSFIPPQVVPASDTAKTNAPVKQANNTNNSTSAAPKSFKELFKEAKKQAKNMIKNVKNASNNIFRARRKEVQSNICPKCHLPKEILCPDCQRKDDESRLNSQRDTQKEDQKDNENPKNYKDNDNDNDNNNEKNDNSTPRRNNYQNDNRNPQRDDNRNNRRNNQGNDNNRRNPQRDDKNNNRRNNQGNDNNRRNPPQRDDNKNNRRNDYGSGNRRNNQGNDKDNNRRPDFGNSRRKSQDDNRKNNLRSLPFNGRRSDNKNYLRGNSDNKYNSRTFEKRNGEHDVDFDNYRYYATNNTTMENRRTITIVKRGDIVIANDEM